MQRDANTLSINLNHELINSEKIVLLSSENKLVRLVKHIFPHPEWYFPHVLFSMAISPIFTLYETTYLGERHVGLVAVASLNHHYYHASQAF